MLLVILINKKERKLFMSSLFQQLFCACFSLDTFILLLSTNKPNTLYTQTLKVKTSVLKSHCGRKVNRWQISSNQTFRK